MSPNICRICGTSVNLIHVLQGGQELLEKLRVCANIEIDFDGHLPKHICMKCEKGLDFSYCLRKQSEATEQKLLHQLQRNADQTISVDLSDDVDYVEDNLNQFSAYNANKLDDEIDEAYSTDVANVVEVNKATKAVKTNSKAEVENDDVVFVEPKITGFDEFRATTISNTVGDEDVAEVFSPYLSMESTIDSQQMAVAASGPFVDGNGRASRFDDDVEIIEYDNKVIDKPITNPPDDDDVQIIEDFQPTAEKHESSVTFNTDLAEAAVHLDKQFNEPFYETSSFVECQLEEESISDVNNHDNVSTSVMQSDGSIIAQHLLDGGMTQEDYNAGISINYDNVLELIENRMQLNFETIQKPSIDLIEKIEVASDDECIDYNDNDGYAEEEEESSNEITPKVHSALLTLQSRGSLKVSLVYKCDTCLQNFKSQSEYRLHIKEHGRKRYVCTQCDKWFPSRYRLQQHERIHSDDSDFYICSICANRYRHPQNLKRHMRSAHDVDLTNPYRCGVCNEEFHGSDILRKHMAKHGEAPRHTCELCSTNFKSMFSLMAHKRTHEAKITNVNQHLPSSTNCTPNYTSTDSSSSPQPSNVSKQRTYYCAFCGKVSKHSFAHKNHMRTHSNERPFPCDFCTKKFRTLAAKITHERIHNDVRPYQCERCLVSFRQSSHLKDHMRVHDGIMQFTCTVCNIAFVKKCNLKVHMRIHTGERPYKCADSACGEQFAKLSQLKRHAAQAHARDVEVREDDEEEDEEDEELEECEGITEEDGVGQDLLLRQCNIANVHMIDEDSYLDVGDGNEETDMEHLIGNSEVRYNSLYIMDEINRV